MSLAALNSVMRRNVQHVYIDGVLRSMFAARERFSVREYIKLCRNISLSCRVAQLMDSTLHVSLTACPFDEGTKTLHTYTHSVLGGKCYSEEGSLVVESTWD